LQHQAVATQCHDDLGALEPAIAIAGAQAHHRRIGLGGAARYERDAVCVQILHCLVLQTHAGLVTRPRRAAPPALRLTPPCRGASNASGSAWQRIRNGWQDAVHTFRELSCRTTSSPTKMPVLPRSAGTKSGKPATTGPSSA